MSNTTYNSGEEPKIGDMVVFQEEAKKLNDVKSLKCVNKKCRVIEVDDVVVNSALFVIRYTWVRLDADDTNQKWYANNFNLTKRNQNLEDCPKNNDGRAICFWCGGSTKKVQGFMSAYDVCERCGK